MKMFVKHLVFILFFVVVVLHPVHTRTSRDVDITKPSHAVLPQNMLSFMNEAINLTNILQEHSAINSTLLQEHPLIKTNLASVNKCLEAIINIKKGDMFKCKYNVLFIAVSYVLIYSTCSFYLIRLVIQ